jgi:hypothetical protein
VRIGIDQDRERLIVFVRVVRSAIGDVKVTTKTAMVNPTIFPHEAQVADLNLSMRCPKCVGRNLKAVPRADFVGGGV